MTTPGVRERKQDGAEEEHVEELSGEAATAYRSTAARSNFLATSMCDLACATKELFRRMATRTCEAVDSLNRVFRYFRDSPLIVYKFAWQLEREMTVFVHADFARCYETRRSTSGGVALQGATS